MYELRYIEETPLNYRKDYGQFFTPPPVARLMVKWILKDNPERVLDPAFGLGVFYDEAIRISLRNQINFVGYEIDKNILEFANHNDESPYLRVINSDYLEVEVEKFDGIICNPPYMRFQKFLKRHDILPKIEEKIGKKLIGYSNISSIFLVKSLKELKVNGNLAYIMPFEFFNTGYGKEIKKSLLESHLLKQIIIFSNEKEIFPDATTTVCVLLCKNDGIKETIKILQIKRNDEIDNISDISKVYQQEIEPSDLPYNKKWTPIIASLFSAQKAPNGFCNLSLYGTVTRGIATGANEFFALAKSTIEKWKLNDNNICKCITKSSQIRKAVFIEHDFNILHNADKPVHCLDVKEQKKQEIRNYIKQGETSGYHERYLTRMRNPWFKIEHRKPAPILFGVFNRGRLKVIRNFTTAINFTCFHSFYPNIFYEQLTNKLFVYLISDIGQEIIKTNKRSYGDSLDKFEPSDLNDSLCPNQSQFEMIDNREVDNVIEIAKTDEKLAIQLSNNLIERIINAQENTAPDGNSGALH
ncbi:N-6 DNA methylase [Gloeomargarita lithophora Alchichica-D10]|uniref:N-6 DNA methylase n=1 Tax=Gloeomargarita lithophora Alchichica-D10 TaxID=1188229 RepID=A0A1J0ADM4_9CYAN|nr:N-6 DNA methylase [Gloeomargarita lithophora]APB34046.1 N-6 DNA methylase [Gloeomargarita lithophora Alchichica-D10]